MLISSIDPLDSAHDGKDVRGIVQHPPRRLIQQTQPLLRPKRLCPTRHGIRQSAGPGPRAQLCRTDQSQAGRDVTLFQKECDFPPDTHIQCGCAIPYLAGRQLGVIFIYFRPVMSKRLLRRGDRCTGTGGNLPGVLNWMAFLILIGR